jgi:hypothetical protein
LADAQTYEVRTKLEHVTSHQKICSFLFISNGTNEDGNLFLRGSFSNNSNNTDYSIDDDGDDDDDDDD